MCTPVPSNQDALGKDAHESEEASGTSLRLLQSADPREGSPRTAPGCIPWLHSVALRPSRERIKRNEASHRAGLQGRSALLSSRAFRAGAISFRAMSITALAERLENRAQLRAARFAACAFPFCETAIAVRLLRHARALRPPVQSHLRGHGSSLNHLQQSRHLKSN